MIAWTAILINLVVAIGIILVRPLSHHNSPTTSSRFLADAALASSFATSIQRHHQYHRSLSSHDQHSLLFRHTHFISMTTVTGTVTAATTMATSKSADDMTVDTDTTTTTTTTTTTSSSNNLPSAGLRLDPNQPISNCAIIGVGVLGTHLLQQVIHHNYRYYQSQHDDLPNANIGSNDSIIRRLVVTGLTKTTDRHDSILQQVLSSFGPDDTDPEILRSLVQLRTNDDDVKNDNDDHDNNDQCSTTKYDNVVFCAPPSGFDSYPTALQQAIDQYWNKKGVFVYTSSGAVYGDPPTMIVTEQTPVADPITSTARIQRLVQAEQIVLQNGGCCLRLAGLYNLLRGPHNYWLTSGKETITSSPNGMVNLLHYEDAANACYHALLLGRDVCQQKVFLISDGVPITRYQICQYAKLASYYRDYAIPQFVVNDNENDNEALGKVYDGTHSNQVLHWQPKYTSFQQHMIDHA